MNHRRPTITLSLAFLLSILLLPAGSGAYSASDPATSKGAVDVSLTQELVQRRLATLEAEEPSTALSDNYRDVLKQLKQRDTHRQEREYYLSTIADADEQIAEIRARIDAIDTAAAKVDASALALQSDSSLESLIADLERELARWRDTRSTIDRRTASLSSPAESVQARLKAIAARQAELPDAGTLSISLSALPSGEEASQWLKFAEFEALEAERRALQAEMESRPFRLNRDRLESEEAAMRGRILEHNLQVARKVTANRAEEQFTDILDSYPAGSPGREFLENLIARRDALVRNRNRLANELANASLYLNTLQLAQAEIQRNYDNTRVIVESAGDSGAFGALFIRYRQQLDDNNIETTEARPSISIGDLVIQNADHEERLYTLLSASEHIDKRLASIGSVASIEHELRDNALTIALAERELLGDIISQEEKLLPMLRDIKIEKARLNDLREKFRSFLQGRLLWLRSQSPIHKDFRNALARDYKKLATIVSGSRLGGGILPAAAGLLLLAVLLGGRKFYRKSIADISKFAGKPRSDSIALTAKALLFCLLLAAPLPLATSVVALAYDNLNESAAATVSRSLFLLASIWLATGAVHRSGKHGVLTQHFGWQLDRCRQLSRIAKSTGRILAPVSVLAIVASALQMDSFDNVIGQLFLATAFLVAAVLFIRFALRLFSDQESGMYRYYAVLGIAAFSVFLVWSVLAGYMSAPLMVLHTTLYSIAVILLLVYVQAFLERWVLVTRRAIRFRRLVESQTDAPVEADDEESYIADLGDLSTTAGELIRAGVIFTGLVSLALIWAPLLPGISGLEDIVLWSTTSQDGTETKVQAVTLASILMAAVIALFAYQAARKLPALLELVLQNISSITPGGRYAAVTLLNYVIVGAGIMIVLSTLGIQWSNLQWLVAALGVGIGFGLQEMVANFISGLIILFERPIRVGDLVTVGDSSGKVTRIRIRATTIVDFDNKELLVPNKEFVTGRLLNWSLSNSTLRLIFDVGIAYGSDVSKALKILHETIKSHPSVAEEPEPSVFFTKFGDNALNMSVRVFLDSHEDRWQVLSDLHQAIDAAFREADICIAFPQRDVHFDASEPIKISINNG